MSGDPIKLDLKDRKILFELDLDSRQPYASIAKKVGLSKQVVKFRVERLVKRGVIKKFITLWNISKLGFSQYNIYLRFKRISPEKEEELIDFAFKSPQVNWMVSTSGRWDLIIATHFKSIEEFYNFLQEKIIFKYADIIHARRIMVLSSLNHFRRHHWVDKKREKIEIAHAVKPAELAAIDEIDKKIIRMLTFNSRESLIKIAKKLGVSSELIKIRIKKMVDKKIIQSFWLTLDYQKVGLEYYKNIITFRHLTAKRKKDLMGFCALSPNVIYAIDGVGIGDFHIDIEVKNAEERDKFLSGLRKNFSDLLEDYETLTITKEHKLGYELTD